MSDSLSRHDTPEEEIVELAKVFKLTKALKQFENGGSKKSPPTWIISLVGAVLFALIGAIYADVKSDLADIRQTHKDDKALIEEHREADLADLAEYQAAANVHHHTNTERTGRHREEIDDLRAELQKSRERQRGHEQNRELHQ